MPLYDYDCSACGRRFEVAHGVHVESPACCPLCGSGPVRKAITAAAIHYKGSGWAKKERRATTASSSKASSETAAPSDAAPAESASSPDGGPSESSPASSSKATDAATPATKD